MPAGTASGGGRSASRRSAAGHPVRNDIGEPWPAGEVLAHVAGRDAGVGGGAVDFDNGGARKGDSGPRIVDGEPARSAVCRVGSCRSARRPSRPSGGRGESSALACSQFRPSLEGRRVGPSTAGAAAQAILRRTGERTKQAYRVLAGALGESRNAACRRVGPARPSVILQDWLRSNR
jgi:hypothetical protein